MSRTALDFFLNEVKLYDVYQCTARSLVYFWFETSTPRYSQVQMLKHILPKLVKKWNDYGYSVKIIERRKNIGSKYMFYKGKEYKDKKGEIIYI